MKVILLKDIPKLGKKYDIKDVAEGHALNMLIPRGFVSLATPQALNKLKDLKEKDNAEKKIQANLLERSLDTIRSAKIIIKGKANDKGHLFAGINKDELIDQIFKQIHLNLDPDIVVLSKSIKEVGEHRVSIEALGKKVELTVIVEAK